MEGLVDGGAATGLLDKQAEQSKGKSAGDERWFEVALQRPHLQGLSLWMMIHFLTPLALDTTVEAPSSAASCRKGN